jgi:hypothetical protein
MSKLTVDADATTCSGLFDFWPKEAFNIALAAVDGRGGGPGGYRNYRRRQFRQAAATQLQKSRRLPMEAPHGN